MLEKVKKEAMEEIREAVRKLDSGSVNRLMIALLDLAKTRKKLKAMEEEEAGPIKEQLKEIKEAYTPMYEALEPADEEGREALLEELKKKHGEEAEVEPVLLLDGEVAFPMPWTVEAVDLKKISREYLMVDEKKAREAVRKGVRKIPGFRIYRKRGVRVTVGKEEQE